MFWIITTVVVCFIAFLIIKDPTIVNRSISYSYYEDRQTAVVWGAFGGSIGMLIAMNYPSPLTAWAGLCLALIPIAGDFNRNPITYIHYGLAVMFYFLMLLYTGAFSSAFMYAVVSIIMAYNKRIRPISLFWVEVAGIIAILVELYLKIN